MADGFLGRWARRKNDASLGRPLEEPAPAARVGDAPASAPKAGTAPAPVAEAAAGAEGQPQEPQPSMEDVQTLTQQSDYSPFVAREVDAGVRNAAMKKLFTDPHFNKIDWMDVYMDDYSKLATMPLSMVRKMASAKFLNLFDEDKDKNAEPAVRDNESGSLPAARVAASETPQPGTSDRKADEPARDADSNTTEHHDDTDLRLQQDHAAGPGGTGRGTE